MVSPFIIVFISYLSLLAIEKTNLLFCPSSYCIRVKRQRYQYKLKQEGRHSTLSDEREEILNRIGFVWDSHNAAWTDRWNELLEFVQHHGHPNVPTNYLANRRLSVWVKCQRRQYKLHRKGHRSNMTSDRIQKLESIGFVWNPRGLKEE